MLAPRYSTAEAVEFSVPRPARPRRVRMAPVAKPQPKPLVISRTAAAGLLALVLLSSFLVAYRNTALTQLGYQAEQLRAELAVVQRANSELATEAASLGSLARVERIATTRLGMARPAGSVVIASLERSGGTIVASGTELEAAAATSAPVPAAPDQGGFIGRLWDLLRQLARNTVEAARLGD